MFIAREKELTVLERKYGSGRAELIILYGRRRVGKTALIRELLWNSIFVPTGHTLSPIFGNSFVGIFLRQRVWMGVSPLFPKKLASGGQVRPRSMLSVSIGIANVLFLGKRVGGIDRSARKH